MKRVIAKPPVSAAATGSAIVSKHSSQAGVV
jgi:hypothetical protein